MDQYAVIGDPIQHSLSPQIHTLFAQQTEQMMQYRALQVPKADFEQCVSDFFQAGGQGLNVTVPLKELAWQFVDQRVELAERAGAINTIARQNNNQLYGYNTDGIGLVRDLCINQKLDLQGLKILLLGAGGAVRGVLQPLLSLQPQVLHIANRTVSKARQLTIDFIDIAQQSKVSLGHAAYTELAGESYDLIINGTSLSLQAQVPPLPAGLVAGHSVVYDMAYSHSPTTFVQWGIQQGASSAIDGRGMLVEQAAVAFKLWRGVMPMTQPAFGVFN